MSTNEQDRVKVGELRPSQVLTTFGIGAIVDLPHLSVMVMGLDDWPVKMAVEIGEDRLLASVKEALGHQVMALKAAPVAPDAFQVNSFDSSSLVGIPVAPFPRWLVCTYCRRLAPLNSGLFKLEKHFRMDQIKYIHANCSKPGKPPVVVPARFLVACKNGHLDDFPWREFVHQGTTSCPGGLKLLETSATGEAASIFVQCEGPNCGISRPMSDAFKSDTQAMPYCKARRPHLRDHDDNGCKSPTGHDNRVEPMLQGASNAWFGISLTALSIPQASGKLRQLIDDHWVTLEKVQSEQNIELLLQVTQNLRDLSEFTPAEIWQAVQSKKNNQSEDDNDPTDLKMPEWEVLIKPESVETSRDFQLKLEQPPKKFAKYFEKIVKVERLREVRALIGFSRIESPSDYDNPVAFPDTQRAMLSRNKPTWVPASETRGEGLFFHFREDLIRKWVKKNEALEHTFFEAHKRWRTDRKLLPPEEFFPGIRFVFLHSFAHAVIRQLSIECGYTTASLRERIYSRNPGESKPEMAGVLIYTAAPDSEGTLGGLVSLGKPEVLERHLEQALDSMRLCASDPLCAEHHPHKNGSTLHAAACHACLFAPETSCERGNKYLDRTVLVPTVESESGGLSELAFFQ